MAGMSHPAKADCKKLWLWTSALQMQEGKAFTPVPALNLKHSCLSLVSVNDFSRHIFLGMLLRR